MKYVFFFCFVSKLAVTHTGHCGFLQNAGKLTKKTKKKREQSVLFKLSCKVDDKTSVRIACHQVQME